MTKCARGDTSAFAALEAGAAVAALAWLPWVAWAALFVPPARAITGTSSDPAAAPPVQDQAEDQEFELIP